MNSQALSLDQGPPIDVPFRFLLTAPAFGILAAALVWWQGELALVSRWTPGTLAATHAITLGFMGLVMIGSLMQMLPVVAGSPVPRVSLTAWVVHPSLTVGTLLLVSGFALPNATLIGAGGVVLVLGLGAFILAAAWSLTRVPSVNPTVTAMRLSLGALLITVVIAFLLVRTWAWGAPLPAASLRNLHPLWGLGGWTALLVASSAYQVVPMFQTCPPYPPRSIRLFAPLVFALLAAHSLAPEGRLQTVTSWLLAAGAVYFAALTFHTQSKRRRRTRDVTLDCWRLSLTSLALGAIGWAGGWLPEVTVGVLLTIGFALSVIIGMLHKIVPFLSWFHLHARAGPGVKVPLMKNFLAESPQRLQFAVHLGAVVALTAATIWPRWLFHPALLLFAASMILLWRNLLGALVVYRRVARELES